MKTQVLILFGQIFIFLYSCKAPLVSSKPPMIEDNYVLPLLYATNRAFKSEKLENLFTGGKATNLSYGLLKVSIPKIHQRGKLEVPNFIDRWKNQHRDSTRFFLLKDNKFLDQNMFFDSLKNYLGSGRDSSQAYIFIHGFNTDFKEAALRSAQLFYDLNASGIPIMFTWPSSGNMLGYWKDKKIADKSVEAFRTFIVETAKNTHGNPLNIIAHSMGNRVLTQALKNLHNDFPNIKFNNVIMAAPDVATKDFEQLFFDDMKKSANEITLYSSNKDKALKVSRYLNLKKRLGLAGKNLFVSSGLTTIDLTELPCRDILSHSCHVENPVLDDIENIFISTYIKDSPLDRLRKLWGNDLYYFILNGIQ